MELTAEENLRRQGFQPFLPLVGDARIVRGAKTLRLRPYVPGYIFTNFDAEVDPWQRINHTRGVQRLLCAQPELPSPVRAAAMKLIFDRCDGQVVRADDLDDALVKFVPVGSTVKLREGPFEGHVGRVTLSEQARVNIVLSLFGRRTTVKNVPAANVELMALA